MPACYAALEPTIPARPRQAPPSQCVRCTITTGRSNDGRAREVPTDTTVPRTLAEIAALGSTSLDSAPAMVVTRIRRRPLAAGEFFCMGGAGTFAGGAHVELEKAFGGRP